MSAPILSIPEDAAIRLIINQALLLTLCPCAHSSIDIMKAHERADLKVTEAKGSLDQNI